MSEKIYVPKSSVKTRETSFGDVLRLNFNVKALGEFLREQKEHINAAGYVTLDIVPRKEKGQFDETHNVLLDTWKPDASKAKSAGKPAEKTKATKPKTQPKTDPLDDPETTGAAEDDIPF